MAIIILSKLIFLLPISNYKKTALSACTFYMRPKDSPHVAMLCGCAKQLRIGPPKIYELCEWK